MSSYQNFYNKYSSVADIYIVYILEAHFVKKDADGNFTGGWPIGYQYNYEQPKSLEQRRKMVELLLDEFHPTIPILMDKMDNNFQNVYKPWPDRAFVFFNDKIKYMAKINDDGTRNTFWTNEITNLLDNELL
jgi:hypothetical protein